MIRVASLFSGCGGSSLGYRLAGCRIVFANEFVDVARETYSANADPSTIVDGRDVRLVRGAEIPEFDLLDGSPPCSSFSLVGKREDGWGKATSYSEDKVQRTDDLFDEYLRILDETRPRAFLAENVLGLAVGKAKGYLSMILSKAEGLGYVVSAKIVDAAFLGVPQHRKRTIIVGLRRDVFESTGPYSWPTLREPIVLRTALQSAIPPACEEEIGPSIDGYAIGREWKRMGRPGTKSLKFFQLVRPSLERPCPTITATASQVGAASVCHPTEARKFSIPELRRIFGFPDDFVLRGTYQQRAERIGRSVPPPMMRSLAESLRAQLERSLP